MKVGIDIDVKELTERFGLSEKNVAYAAVNAVNATAKQVQEAERANVKTKFKVRKMDFMMRQAAIIKPFASVGQARPYAEIAVGQKDRLLLTTFEQGGVKLPFVGKNVAVPITGSPARPDFGGGVPENMRIAALNLKPQLSASQRMQARSIKGSSSKETKEMRKQFAKSVANENPWQGNQRTYMIPGVGVFQRTGKGKRDTTLIYKFIPRPQLKPTLGFVALARDQGERMLRSNLETAVIKEMAKKK